MNGSLQFGLASLLWAGATVTYPGWVGSLLGVLP